MPILIHMLCVSITSNHFFSNHNHQSLKKAINATNSVEEGGKK